MEKKDIWDASEGRNGNVCNEYGWMEWMEWMNGMNGYMVDDVDASDG